MMRMRVGVVGALSLAVLALTTAQAAAYVFTLDRLTISKNGSPFFEDAYDDGNPPPSAPNFASGDPGSYNTGGGLSEAGGRLIFDSAAAALSTSGITGGPILINRARLQTNTQPLPVTGTCAAPEPGTSCRGLKRDDTFVVEALFDLELPAPNGEYYALRLTDVVGTGGDDVLEVRVRIDGSGDPIVQFRHLDVAADTVTVLASDLIPVTGGAPDHEQIMLRLAKNDANTDTITASYEYFDGGIGQGNASFAGVGDIATRDIFTGEDWTRAEVRALVPVPAPAAGALFALGLAGLGLLRRRAR